MVFKYYDVLKKEKKIILGMISFTIFFLIWFLLSYSNSINSIYLPTPKDTFRELFFLINSGEIVPHLTASLYRISIGFGLASVIGILVGSIAGTFSKIRYLILPLNSSLRYIPPTAFISLTIIWFGIGEAGKISLIFIAIFFYIIQMSADIVNTIPKIYIEASQMLGANKYEIFRKVIMPFSLPGILTILRINLGAAWTFLIVSELVASQKGIGYLMAISQRFLQTPKLFALIFIVGFLGFLSDALLSFIINRVGKWRQ